ncbi:hypothetical protein E2C01_046416 [Portunus trituberculatus]|uniref:Uncharacterized protein n=1 Tax=Portunus trituberculatus TaxID=210409 RepID=A0A5B7G547_PORTR|nr:hypothetical protein [Portunus trituberculatus]
MSETHLCAERMTEVIVSGMEAYIPHSFSQPEHSKPWFNTGCSRATHYKEVAWKRDDQPFRKSPDHAGTPQNDFWSI